MLIQNWSDKMSKLQELPFAYKVFKSQEVFIYHHGKQVTRLGKKQAAQFLSQIELATEEKAQQLMARITGNYKRGNER